MTNIRYALHLVARKPVVLALLLPYPIMDTILSLLRGLLVNSSVAPMDQIITVTSMVLMLVNGLLIQPVVLGLLLESVQEETSIPGWYLRYLRLHWYKPMVVLLAFVVVAMPLFIIFSIIYFLGSALLQITTDSISFGIIISLIMSMIMAPIRLLLAAMTQLPFKDALRKTLSQRSRIIQMVAASLLVVLISLLVTNIGHALGVTDVSSANLKTLFHVGESARQTATALRYSGWLSLVQLLVSAPTGVFLIAYSFALVYSKKPVQSATTRR